MLNEFESTVSPLAELPRQGDEAVLDQTYAAGFTPTKSGEWVVPMLVIVKPTK